MNINEELDALQERLQSAVADGRLVDPTDSLAAITTLREELTWLKNAMSEQGIMIQRQAVRTMEFGERDQGNMLLAQGLDHPQHTFVEDYSAKAEPDALQERLENLRLLARGPGDPIREPRRSHITRYHNALAKAWEGGAFSTLSDRVAELEAENERLGDLFDDLCYFNTPEARRAHLAELARRQEVQVNWHNGCDKTIPVALRYLAKHDRPSGGEDAFNRAHLEQLADEFELMVARIRADLVSPGDSDWKEDRAAVLGPEIAEYQRELGDELQMIARVLPDNVSKEACDKINRAGEILEGRGSKWTLPPEDQRPEGYRCLAMVEMVWEREFTGGLGWHRPDEHRAYRITEGAPGTHGFLPLPASEGGADHG